MNPFFKAYCYPREGAVSLKEPTECAEISLQATPDVLRQVAAFMMNCALRIEASQSENIEHFHLQDEWTVWSQTYPDVIVVSPPSEK